MRILALWHHPQTQNPELTNLKKRKLKDLLHLLRVGTALLLNCLASYGVAKWHENSNSMRDFKTRYIRTPAAKVLIKMPEEPI